MILIFFCVGPGSTMIPRLTELVPSAAGESLPLLPLVRRDD